MSNLAVHLVYASFNRVPGVACHRFFSDECALDSRTTRHLPQVRSIETGEPLSNYQVVAFSLNYENDLLNIGRILLGSGIPLLATQRDSTQPLIIAGGVIATINPEPLAPMIDAFILGEAEILIPALADTLASEWVSGRSREVAIGAIGALPGVYIPEWYQPVYDREEHLASMEYCGPKPSPSLRRLYVDNLDSVPGSMVIHTPFTEFKEIHLVEISRGCPRSCRFCLIPACYGPFRHRSVDSIVKEASNAPAGWRIGLLGAGGADHPDLAEICRQLEDKKFRYSFSSLHASGITPQLVSLIHSAGPRTLTLAPEAGTDRQRHKIGKMFKDEDVFAAVRSLAHEPVRTIKMYFMIGLPGETAEDLDALVGFCHRIQQLIRETNRGRKTIPRLAVGVSCFVPKAMSPFERSPMQQEKDLRKRLKHVADGLRSAREIRWTHDAPRRAVVQGMIARADRRLSTWMAAAAQAGSDWYELIRELPEPLRSGAHQRLTLARRLPWDHLKVPLYCGSDMLTGETHGYTD